MRLTSREKEILEFLKKEPLATQDELSNRFGISRSSVGVHISNLMRKGVILGKGYVFNEQVSIVVIGDIYLNINVTPDDNNAAIDLKYGGFAVDLGQAFVNYGVNVKVISVTGNDDLGNNIINLLKDKQVDVSNIYRHPEQRSCRRIYINNEKSFEEVFNYEEYEKVFSVKEWVAFNCEWLVVEPRFHEIIYQKFAVNDEEKLPNLCTYKILSYPEDIPEFFSKYNVVVLGVSNSEYFQFYVERARELVRKGTQNCIITDGESGLAYYSDETVVDFALLPNQGFSTTKIPFLLAGVVYGLSCRYPFRQAIRIGVGSASASGY